MTSPFSLDFQRPMHPRIASTTRMARYAPEDDDEWEEYISQYATECEEKGEESDDIWARVAQMSDEREEILAAKKKAPVAAPFTFSAAATGPPPPSKQDHDDFVKKVMVPNFKFDIPTLSAGADRTKPVFPNLIPAMPASQDRQAAAADAKSKRDLKESQEREEADYNKIIEAQNEAEAALKRATDAEARERKLKIELADLQKEHDELSDTLNDYKEKHTTSVKEREVQNTAKVDLEEKRDLAEQEIASLYKELQQAREESHKYQDEADEKEAALNELAQDLYRSETKLKEAQERNEVGNAAQERLDNINDQFEQIFEEIGGNLTIEEFIKHYRDVQTGNITRGRRDSQASNTSFRNANGNRPNLKQRQVSIHDELMRVDDTNDDEASPETAPISPDTKSRVPSDPVSPKHTKALVPNYTGSPTPRAHRRTRRPSIDAIEEPFGEKYTVRSSTTTDHETQTEPVQTEGNVTIINQHVTQSKTRQPAWWVLILMLILYLLFEVMMHDTREWRWANDTGRQGRGGVFRGEPLLPFRGAFERWVGVDRSLLG